MSEKTSEYIPWLGSSEYVEAEEAFAANIANEEEGHALYNAIRAEYLDRAEAEIVRLQGELERACSVEGLSQAITSIAGEKAKTLPEEPEGTPITLATFLETFNQDCLGRGDGSHQWVLTEDGYYRTWGTSFNEKEGTISAESNGWEDFSDEGDGAYLNCGWCGSDLRVPNEIDIDFN